MQKKESVDLSQYANNVGIEMEKGVNMMLFIITILCRKQNKLSSVVSKKKNTLKGISIILDGAWNNESLIISLNSS